MDSWKRDLEQRAAKAPLINRYRPTPEMPRSNPNPAMWPSPARQSSGDEALSFSPLVIIWLSICLAASFAGNIFQGLLYVALLEKLK